MDRESKGVNVFTRSGGEITIPKQIKSNARLEEAYTTNKVKERSGPVKLQQEAYQVYTSKFGRLDSSL